MCLHLFNKKYKEQVNTYIEKMYSYGIQRIDLPGLPLEYWEEFMEAVDIMHQEFPEIFKYLYGFLNEHDIESFGFSYCGDYKTFCQLHSLGYIKVNVSNIISKDAVAKRLKCKECGFHKDSSVKSYILHELTHLLENVITFREKTRVELNENTFNDYYVSKQYFDVSTNIFFSLYGNLDRNAILGESAYGNKNVSEFLAEAIAEYFCLNEHQVYMEQMYKEMKKLYNKNF